MTDPGEYGDLADTAWDQFCEENGYEPSDIEEMELVLAEDDEMREQFDEWLAGGF